MSLMTEFAIAVVLVGLVLLTWRLLHVLRRAILLTAVLVLDILLIALKAIGRMLGLEHRPHQTPDSQP
jgi:hypothetical protein